MTSSLVLGASGALGAAFAARLSQHGSVLAHGCSSPPRPADAYVLADLTTPSGRAALCATAESCAPFDFVVLAFGRVGFAPLAITSDASLEEMFALHALAPIALIRDLAPLCADGAVFMCFTGAVLERPTLQMSAYTAAKGALAASLPVLRREFRNRRFRFLDLRLPHCDTPLAARPSFGAAPTLPVGLDPARVVDVVFSRLGAPDDLFLPEHFSG